MSLLLHACALILFRAYEPLDLTHKLLGVILNRQGLTQWHKWIRLASLLDN